MPALFIRFRDVICVLKNTVKMRYRMYLTLLISLRRPEYRGVPWYPWFLWEKIKLDGLLKYQLALYQVATSVR